MRILIVNKFYYPRGGDCVVAMSLERLLKEQGHEVAFHAMRYPENEESAWSRYFASQVDFAGGLGNKVAALCRTMGWGDIVDSFKQQLEDFDPQVVHLHNIHSYLSPVVARLAKEHGCRVVWTMHDYKLVCPSYSCLNSGGSCEQCVGGSKWHVLKNRCMKGSLVASAVGYLEALKWNRHKLQRYTDVFIAPSRFMAAEMEKGGFDTAKLRVVCNHVDGAKKELFDSLREERGDYYTYVGRLSVEKGVERLLAVASRLPFTLKVAGDGPLMPMLRERYSSCENIEFAGRLDSSGVARLLSGARAMVIPSEWFENNPLSVIESLCAGTPVIGARIGGIPELLTAENGVLFASGDEHDMERAITAALSREWNHEAIALNASQRFSQEQYLKKITEIYAGE